MKLIYLAAFGLAGVLARHLVNEGAKALSLDGLPWATFTVNMLGAFLIAAAWVAATEKGAFGPELRLGIMVGFLGGFTTFSSLALETVTLYSGGRHLHAALYLALTNALGVAAVLAGLGAGRLLYR